MAAIPRRGEVQQMLEKMLSQETIEPAQGAWSSPIILVKKKDGSTRFCVRMLSLPSRQHRQQPRVSIPYLQSTLHPRCGCQWGWTRDSSFHGQEWKFDKDRMPILCNTQRDVGVSLGSTTLSTILVWSEVQSND